MFSETPLPAHHPVQTHHEMTQYLAGMIFGMTGHDHHRPASMCMYIIDPEEISHLTEVAVDDIAENRYFKGVRYFGKIIYDLGLIAVNCQMMADDLARIQKWSKVLDNPQALAEQVSKNWLEHEPEIKKEVLIEKLQRKAGNFYEAGTYAALALRVLVGKSDSEMTENHSVDRELHREAEFFAGYICGLSGCCDKHDQILRCMDEQAPPNLKESVDSMSEGLMHGQVIDNLIMGLFNLDFSMNDFEEAVADLGCTHELQLESLNEWKEVRHGITHESMSDMQAKIGMHLEEAREASRAIRSAWAV